MVGLSVPELVLIGAIALVVFGPSKLPEVGSALGKTIKEFKKSVNEVEAEPEKKAIAPGEGEAPKAKNNASPQEMR
jgi:sec-independent protein translocase protein TatA